MHKSTKIIATFTQLLNNCHCLTASDFKLNNCVLQCPTLSLQTVKDDLLLKSIKQNLISSQVERSNASIHYTLLTFKPPRKDCFITLLLCYFHSTLQMKIHLRKGLWCSYYPRQTLFSFHFYHLPYFKGKQCSEGKEKR